MIKTLAFYEVVAALFDRIFLSVVSQLWGSAKPLDHAFAKSDDIARASLEPASETIIVQSLP